MIGDRTILVWFRNDLRIHDNEILIEACKKASKIIPIYCFDPRYFTETPFGTLKTGVIRAKFLLESVTGLQKSLQKIGGDLMIVCGRPEEILPEIAGKFNVSEVYHHREVALEETEISGLVEAALWKKQINLKHFIGHTLYHKEDLPFPIKDIPDSFTLFKKKVERESEVRSCFQTPASITIPVDFESGQVLNLSDLGFKDTSIQELLNSEFLGGEAEGIKRMRHFFRESAWVRDPKNNKNDVFYHSSGLSPWIAAGCLSAREVYHEIKKYEQEYGSNDATTALRLNLLWRDYFRFMFKKHGNKFSIKEVFKNSISTIDKAQQKLLMEWKNGQTGIAFIDACMRELNHSGFLSHKGRQMTASYLVNDLNVPWVYGAAFFEEKLIDFSPASNWGNWANLAG